MAKADPFRSANPDDPDVYHNCSRCGLGRAIPAKVETPLSTSRGTKLL